MKKFFRGIFDAIAFPVICTPAHVLDRPAVPLATALLFGLLCCLWPGWWMYLVPLGIFAVFAVSVLATMLFLNRIDKAIDKAVRKLCRK